MNPLRVLCILLTCVIGTTVAHADILGMEVATLNIQNNFGYTVVDVGKAVDSPEYTAANRRGLVEWDQFHYSGLVQLLFERSADTSWGPEIGFNRLYYWEEKYTPVGFDPRWTWDTVWTWHVGGIIRKNLAPDTYVMTGASLHTFFDGSGTTVGIPLAIGHIIPLRSAATLPLTDIPLTPQISLPLEFRVDIIFGDATPIALGGGIGITFSR